MKNKTDTLAAIVACLVLGLVACTPKDDHAGHDHSSHDHGHIDGQAEHSDDQNDDSEHAEKELAKKAGPNGGRLIHSVKPNVEFVVREDRHIQIHFLDDDLKPVATGDQILSLIGGDRTAPFRLAFAKDGVGMLSEKPIPAGDNHPAVLQIKANSISAATFEKFHLNLSDCPTCQYKEYACICEHGDNGQHDH